MATLPNVWQGDSSVIPQPPAPTPEPPYPTPPPTPPSPLMAITQSFVATAGQTLFTLTLFTYAIGSHQLMVFVNGVFQTPANYTETSTSSVTLGFMTLAVNDVVDIVKVA